MMKIHLADSSFLAIVIILLVLPTGANAFSFNSLFCAVPILRLFLCDHCVYLNQPCRNGGTCLDQIMIGTYECVCQKSWSGENCETLRSIDDFDSCESDTCWNGGTCQDDGFSITCRCGSGFGGNRCETEGIALLCNPTLCQNGGTCQEGSATNAACSCPNGFTGDRCETATDICQNKTCQNEGSCLVGGDCFCREGFIGDLCEINIDECAPNPCANGGVCEDDINAYSCNCSAGFTGKRCEINIDECNPNPCLNNGSCVDGINDYSCTCAIGFNGEDCEINIDNCDPNPCENDGSCEDGIDAYNCTCPIGFSGDRCETNINECDPNPCSNGGICEDGIASYNCTCLDGFLGDRCDLINDCFPDPCLNGGVCEDGIDSFSCTCNSGWTGINCGIQETKIYWGYTFFGTEVAIDGNTLVISSPYYASGSVYIFIRSGTEWTLQATLIASDGIADDFFGASVGIDGNTLVIGASLDDDKGSASGSAYIFIRSGTSWTEQAKLNARDGAVDDRFGTSVAISGESVVIGTGNLSNGRAYIFIRSGVEWPEEARLVASDGPVQNFFGSSVAISGETAVIGADWDDNVNGIASGSVYIFTRSGSIWTEQAKLIASGGTDYEYFGRSVAIVGNKVVIGAIEGGDNGIYSGCAYVFLRAGTTWTEQAKLMADDGAEGDWFGVDVAIYGDSIVIGASDDNDGTGSAYIFSYDGNSWMEQHKLIANDGAANYRFGWTVAMHGKSVVVGAPYGGSSSAYVFEL